MTFRVSVIIPAYNAAATLHKSVNSVLAQTLSDWEAIIVNDGSTDETETIAAQFAAQDHRIHTLTQVNQGVSAARNTGINQAQYEWLLFLDADDWIAPEFLASMGQPLLSDPSLDLIHCQWSWIAEDGTPHDYPLVNLKDMFPLTARGCPLAMHGCIIRKAVVEAVGGFDTSLRTCEDWDLWQKVARMGIHTEGTAKVMAFYRMRADSLSNSGQQMLRDGLRVIERGHSADPRVSKPLPIYSQGMPRINFPELQLAYVASTAALLMGVGKDARFMLDEVDCDRAPGLDPQEAAYGIWEAMVLPTCRSRKQAYVLWLEIGELVEQFLEALEAKAKALEFAERTKFHLKKIILEWADIPLPISFGSFYTDRIEVTQPLVDLKPPSKANRFYGFVTLEGDPLGVVELPICDGLVSAWVLADAIAAKFFWPILGRFFEHTVYPQVLGTQTLSPQSVHEKLGWVTFLRELWGYPQWSVTEFYNANQRDGQSPRKHTEDGWLTVEVSEPLPSVRVQAPELHVILTVGGAAIGRISIPIKKHRLSSQALRAALTTDGNLELCRACVREALIGKPITEPTPLRTRLAMAAQQRSHVVPAQTDPIVKLAQRLDPLGSSASRRAVLPVAAMDSLFELATVTQEPVYPPAKPSVTVKQVVYAPDLIERSIPKSVSKSIETDQPISQQPLIRTNLNDRAYFEQLFASQPDPWKYTSEYEQVKYEQTLSLIPQKPIRQALELACAEGHFTLQLAARVESLVAADISQIALDHTAQRCSHLKHIRYQQIDLAKDPIPGKYDLIVCSEVLYYMGGKAELRTVANKMAQALQPDGYLLMAHAHAVIDQPSKPGFNWNVSYGAKGISDTFSSLCTLKLVQEIRTPLYRIQLFQRKPWFSLNWRHAAQITKYDRQPTPLPPEVDIQVLWQGGKPYANDPSEVIVTDNLPILMYHHIAEAGADQLKQWRVTPQAFESQLRYLRDVGYYSVSLGTWGKAIEAKKPLPGKAICITFDDGYLSFFTHAWPLLKQYGFTATVFLVADRVGQVNDWDVEYGKPAPLMNWEQIRQLQAEGVMFGSHTVTHRSLTLLPAAEIVQEGARSRSIIEEKLESPIKTIAYPYGDTDPAIAHLMGACGYIAGVTCDARLSNFANLPLLLPRQEITGFDSLKEFITKLELAQ